jgi:hypothetical protein
MNYSTTNDLKILNAAFKNPENVAIIEEQLADDSSVLSDTVGKPAREAALAAMQSQKPSLEKRTDSTDDSTTEIEMTGPSPPDDDIEQNSAAAGESHDIEEGSDASECDTGPECLICMDQLKTPLVCLLKL